MMQLLLLTIQMQICISLMSNHVQEAIRANQLPIHGVNLGGWLVAEHWMSPSTSLWQGIDSSIVNSGEHVIMSKIGHGVGDAKYDNHRNTFIVESDIAEIASFNLNTVRVPVGWWIIGYDNHDPSNQQDWKTYAPNAIKYLDKLVNEWGLKHNVAILICIHAAKGSQNGQEHSAPSNPGQIYWSKYQENIDNTVEVARFLADRYKNSPAFLGIELLNEPHQSDVDASKLKNYYMSAYNAIRSTGNGCLIVNSPLLEQQNEGGPNNWENLTPPPAYNNVLQDWHKYLIWGYEGKDANWLMNNGIQGIQNDVNRWTGNWLFMGEFSLASSASFNDDQLKQYARNMFGMLKSLQGGFTYWAWSVEGGGAWCMRDMLRRGIITADMWSASAQEEKQFVADKLLR